MLFIILTSMGNIMTKIIFIKYIVLSILVVLTFLFIITRLYCKNKLKIRRFKTNSIFFMIIVRKLRLKGYLVGSSRSSVNGYYKIKTTEEFFENIGMLTSQRDTLSKTITAMIETFNDKEPLIGQQTLFNDF